MEQYNLPLVGVDTHAHLNLSPLNNSVGEVLKRAESAGVSIVGNVFLGPKAYREGVYLFDELISNTKIFFTLGIHPHDSKDIEKDYIGQIESLLQQDKRIRAIGEIGLDFYRNLSPKDIQFKVFKDQLALAKDCDFPVVIHSRDADIHTIKILLDMGFKDRKVIWHCFTRGKEVAKEILSYGWILSIPGVVTFNKARDLQEAIIDIPVERVVLETDCPFLAPAPYRGKTNEPSFVVYTAKKIAEIKNLDIGYIWEKTSENAKEFFDLYELG